MTLSHAPRPSYTSLIRVGLLAVLVAGGGVYLSTHLGRKVIEEAAMAVDDRPERSVLFLGNSRLFVNDTPKLVREIADAAHSPIRYDIHMRAWGGATLKEHANDAGDRALLAQHWDEVVLQTESGTFSNAGETSDFNVYGEQLARAARAGGAHVDVIANWSYGAQMFSGDAATRAAASREYGERIVRETRAFASRAGVGVINLEAAFAEASARAPEVQLTSDGNHPTRAGAYLAALTIYGGLSHADPSAVTAKPEELSEAAAATLRRIASRHVGPGV